MDFRALFEATPICALVLLPDFTIVAATDALLRTTATRRDALLGKNLFEAFPDNPEDPAATGVANLRESLNFALLERAPHTMALQKYSIEPGGPGSGTFTECYWTVVNTPILDSTGEVLYIIHVTENVTELVRGKQEHEPLSREEQDFESVTRREVLLRTQEIRERTAELEKLNALLQVGRDEAVAASKLKSDFVATISHELRTPLSGVTGLLELALLSELTAEQTELIKTAHESAESLLVIVNDILELSSIEAGMPDFDLVPFNAVFLVQDVARLMAESARKKGLVLRTYIDPSIPQFVVGEPERIRQVLLNLIGNAIKFSDKGEVSVKVIVQAQTDNVVTVRFAVEDNGIGISDENLHFLFLPFSQVDSSNTRRFGGTGLGLAISKRLVDLLGGKMFVESQIGSGSTFSFDLPLLRETHLRTRFQNPDHDLSQDASGCCFPQAKLVLIVEDDTVSRLTTAKQLLRLGLQSQGVANGREAIESMRDIEFDLILMDCLMPEMNGFEATSVIRDLELTSGRHLPIIAMTAQAMPGDRDACLAAGMDDYLSKPFTIAELQLKLERWLSCTDARVSMAYAPEQVDS